jgi:uncharacterized pyridoxamine 5'-phosphate oxidase family protein
MIKKIIQFTALGLMLVVLPLGSLIYLRKGYFERYDALQMLKDYGKVPVFTLQQQNGSAFTNDDLKGRYAVIGKIEAFDEANPVIEQSKKLFKQFGDSKEIALCTYVANFDSMKINAFMEKITLQDTVSRWYFLYGDDAITTILANQPNEMLALVDTASVVRNFYKVADNQSIGEMAKHIAMFVAPLKRRSELEFKREKEK